MMNLAKTYQEARETAFTCEGRKYPGKALVHMELEPGYERAKLKLLPHIRTVNEAHLIMLYKQGIVTKEDAAGIMKVLQNLEYTSYKNSGYDGRFEDMYLQMEDEIIRKTDGTGGNLHLARSRNDMCLAWSRMVIREELLSVIRRMIKLQNTITLFAEEHKDTLYVVHTHTQHAQPGLFGHYFLGVADVLNRDISRLQDSYYTVNRSPMGAAAITTSGFPVSREMVAKLAGFDDVITNAYDAIGNCDFFTQSASAIGLCALNLGRVVTDMVLWATQEMGMIKVSDGYISTSSIMPQKRNPIALEHLRASLSTVKGLTDTVLDVFFKAPYGDISDYEDVEDIFSNVIVLFDRNLVLFEAVMATLEVDKKLLFGRAYESFSVVTDMADEMYRSYGIPFRKAHHFVAQLVKKAYNLNYNLKNLSRDFFVETYKEFFGEPFTGEFAPILQSIDPVHFVRSRNVFGGTGHEVMEAMIDSAKKHIDDNLIWLTTSINNLERADLALKSEISSLLELNKMERKAYGDEAN